MYDGGRGIECGHGKECALPDKVRGICPSGWHLPSKAEWEALFTEAGGRPTAGGALKSKTGWKDRNDGSSGNGSDLYGFSARPMGSWNTNNGGYHYDLGKSLPKVGVRSSNLPSKPITKVSMENFCVFARISQGWYRFKLNLRAFC